MSFRPWDIYEVERVLGKRNINGNDEYLIKRIGYPRSECIWTPVEHMNCERLIEEYEISNIRKGFPPRKKKTLDPLKLVGFNRGLEPEIILGVNNSFGLMTFLIKWKGREDPDVVTVDEAKKKCPHLVLEFSSTH